MVPPHSSPSDRMRSCLKKRKKEKKEGRKEGKERNDLEENFWVMWAKAEFFFLKKTIFYDSSRQS